ncbi:MAG: hypothetical protein BWY67_02261 [Bacteroidetes bacterium ADurb.Bin397]|nr:MAG: hypothetical protein BWY67_02261 [Bacteroidetes bacterium ADurb.Bin397]
MKTPPPLGHANKFVPSLETLSTIDESPLSMSVQFTPASFVMYTPAFVPAYTSLPIAVKL